MRGALFTAATMVALTAHPAAAQSDPPWAHTVGGAVIEGRLAQGTARNEVELRVRTGAAPLQLRVLRVELRAPSNEWRRVHWGLPSDAPAAPLDFDVEARTERVITIPHDPLSIPAFTSRREYRVLLEVAGQRVWLRAARLSPSEVVSDCW